MKKLFLFIFAFGFLNSCTDLCNAQTYQLFSVTPFTGFENINNAWVETAPIDLQYNVIIPFKPGSNYFAGAGIGAGLNIFNIGNVTDIKFNVPATIYFGGQPFAGFPAMALGGGKNFADGNWIITYNLHFAATSIVPAITSSRYKAIIHNTKP